MCTKKMINLIAGLFFTVILCLNGGASGYVPSDEACPVSEVVFIDPSVPKMEKIVAQLPEGAEVVKLSPGIDGVAQISTHLKGKGNLSAIHIISHGSPGYFVLNGNRIDGDFLRDHGDRFISWGRALAENGDILLYACNLAATDRGKTFVEKFADLTDADVAASTDITGGKAFDGNWKLEYSTGRIAATELEIDSNIGVKLPTIRTWEGNVDTNWSNASNWFNGDVPTGTDDAVVIGTYTYSPDMDVPTVFASFTINLGSTVNINTNGAINTSKIDGGTGDVTINGTVNAAGAVPISIAAAGIINLNGANSITSGTGPVTLNSGTDGIDLTGASTITSTSGTITFMDIIDGATTLGVNAGTGLIDFQQAIGTSTNLTTLTITQSGGTTFQGNVTTSASVILTDTADGSNITFTGSLATPTLTTTAQGYNVDLFGSGTSITNLVDFLNTGTVALGNAPADTLTFAGGIDATDPSTTTINGTIATSNDPVALGTTTVSGNSTVDPAGGALTFGAVTINSGATLKAGAAGNAGAVSFNSTVDGPGALEINTSGSATFSANIGTTPSLGALTLVNGALDTTGKNITASGLTIDGGTFNTASAAGTWDINGNLSITGGTLNATSGNFNFSGTTWNTLGGTFTANGGTVILDGTGQSLSGGSTTFYNLTKNVTTQDSLAFQTGSANRTIITNALNLGGASGQLLLLRSITPGTQWEIDPQGSRTIAFLDVRDSKNVNATAITGTNSVNSGNNTNWTFPPTITSFSPMSGGTGTSVIITGTNFTGTTEVKFGGTDASDFTVYSFTQIAAIVAGGSTGTVTVINTADTATSSGSFTWGAVTSGTYYVDIQNGDDSDAGTAAAPWKTLHYAIDQINGGDTGTYTLHVAQGATYSTGNGEADTGLIISQSNVTVIGASGSGPIINGTGATSWTYGIKIEGSNVTLRNLYVTGFTGTGPEGTGIEIITGSNNTVENCRVYGNHDGISVWQSANCTIKDCEIDNNNFDGISINESAGSVITRNSIHDNFAVDDSDGIIVEACSPEISRNTIYDNRFNISLQGSTTAPTSPTIKNNLIYEDTLDEVHYGIYTGGITGSTVNPQIYHNTIDGSLYQGILIEGTGDTPIIKYNIVINCRQSGIQNSGNPTIDYNDVWHNGPDPYDRNYDGCTAGANDISQDPQITSSHTLAATSPCINAIPTGIPPGDPVQIDYPGYSRPKGSGFDMGAYEYVGTITYSHTIPGGTGTVTDYRIFTVPLDVGTGADMLSAMEASLGTYNPARWRVFALHNGAYIEINSTDFASLNIMPGMGFWVISLSTGVVNFQGSMAPDGIYYHMTMSTGWHLFAPPWPGTNITLGGITVSDGTHTYAITDNANNLTQTSVWDYTGSGPYSGYEKRQTAAYQLQNGVGYFLKVLSESNVIIRIPAAGSPSPAAPDRYPAGRKSSTRDNEAPPRGFFCMTGTNTGASSGTHALPLPPDGLIHNDLPACSECSVAEINRVVTNEEFDSGTPCECTATESITIGENVTIKGNANVTFKAPRINLRSGFHTQEGAVVKIAQE